MDEAFSSLIGQVDASIDHRSQLVSALRAKFGVEELGSAPIAAPSFGMPVHLEMPLVQGVPSAQSQGVATPTTATGGETFTDVMAQMDRGLDERQRLISALKGQLSQVAAMPKTAPPAAPPASSSMQFPQPAPSANAVPLIPVLSPQTGTSPSWEAAPSTKRARLDGGDAASSPPTAASQTEAEVAELAAMKAKMLGNLQAAESIVQAKAPAMALPVGEEEESTPSAPPISGSTSIAGAGETAPGAPQAIVCPPGTSQEEYEAYRQKCWKEYYEKCAVWQKYYSQYQAEKGKGKGKAIPGLIKAGNVNPGMLPAGIGKGGPMAPGKSSPQVVTPPPGLPMAPAAAGKGRGGPLPGVQDALGRVHGARQRAEEDRKSVV